MLRIRAIFASSLAAALLVPAAAMAAGDPPRPGFEVGARLGYGFSAGHLGAPPNGTDNDLGDFVSGQWPLWLDVGYRLTGAFYLGAYFQYGFGTVNDDQQNGCRNANVDCSASDVRLGLMGRYQFAPVWLTRPWVGFGAGYEWGTFSVHQSAFGNTNTDSTWSGFELANFQAGADFHVASKIVLGPFISLSLGEFRRTSTTTSNGNMSTTDDQDLAKRSLHEWIMFGARIAFMP